VARNLYRRGVAQGSKGEPPPTGEGDAPCRPPRGSGRETPEDVRHTPYASAGEPARSAEPCSVAHGVTSRSGPVPVRTRCAQNSMAKARALSAPGACTTLRSAERCWTSSERVARCVHRSPRVKSWEQTERGAIRTSAGQGPTNPAITLFPSTLCHGVARLVLPVLRSEAAVACHGGPGETLRRARQRASASWVALTVPVDNV
jgi:hypothetical protein